MRVSFLAFSLSALVLLAVPAQAAEITEKMVNEKYAQLEKALNDRNDAMRTIKFLHEHISDDAQFRLTVTNPAAQQGAKSPVMTMSKADYINTYIQGTHQVDDYSVDIATRGFRYDPETEKAVTLDVMTERGAVQNGPMGGAGRDRVFVSRTTCRTSHEIQDGTLVATASECHTDVSFEEEI